MADAAAGSNHDKSSPAPAPALASDDKTSSPVNKQEQVQTSLNSPLDNNLSESSARRMTLRKSMEGLHLEASDFKDHKSAYFDSADWALCKQSANSCPERTAAIESLKPKLKRTPYQPLSPRKPSFASS